MCPQVRQRRRLTQSLLPARAQFSHTGSTTGDQSERTSPTCSHRAATEPGYACGHPGPAEPALRALLILEEGASEVLSCASCARALGHVMCALVTAGRRQPR